MKIVDPGNSPIPANVTFDYKGLVISASTIFTPHSVVVFEAGSTPRDPISKELGTIEAAIEWIDARARREASYDEPN